MKDRIKGILDHFRITPSKFADTIGMQRSAVSHILSGRNKPGLDFLSKILDSYAEISGDWLVTGKGDMLRKKSGAQALPGNLFNAVHPIETKEELKVPPAIGEAPAVVPHASPISAHFQPEELNKTIPAEMKEVTKIVLFYADRSFEIFYP